MTRDAEYDASDSTSPQATPPPVIGVIFSVSCQNTGPSEEFAEIERAPLLVGYSTAELTVQALGAMACKVSLDLEFVLNNGLLGAAAGKLFESVTANLVDALSVRAKQVYG